MAHSVEHSIKYYGCRISHEHVKTNNKVFVFASLIQLKFVVFFRKTGVPNGF